ncbi:MAG: NADH-quinone oxidoreductase subunit D, partial [Nitrospinaceae bacterium]|nr:NADH-quinone oxidoreductase subunit D [Nitrospinaceae bacterium]NIR56096.1 NADH-quinone oxidoreductase subunit D [Nitrospinaceae bacterium]NIS86544.1 NADH-quinone oxidoreductase subunit D [Nitrospinaceae bacterium]NIT83378.1 NADH-quinone oxidoreductase subunit D [Nitrospinaceae bacterium]NIU45588.1 NADH-quinone oxidoreductase subunit D [Nitrospinaceae bacterium]
ILELDGGLVRSVEPDIGYLHTGIEKTSENKRYVHVIPMTDRLDYLNPPGNNLAFCLTTEKLLGCEVPPRAQYLRTIMCELARIGSHLVWLGTHALDIGAMTVFLYCWREREMILDLNEEVSGVRMMTSYIRVGGTMLDATPEWLSHVRQFIDYFPSKVDEYERLLTKNPIWLDRTQDIGVMSREEALNWSLSGPCLRGSGVDFDFRRDRPYNGYENFKFDVPVGKKGDIYDRYRVRIEEMRQSREIIRQALDRLPDGPYKVQDNKISLPDRGKLKNSMEALIHHFKLVSEGISVPPGETYVPTEGPRGEMGFYIVSDGSNVPYRVKLRAPSFMAIPAMCKMMEGAFIADVVAIIGSIDIVMGEVDR